MINGDAGGAWRAKLYNHIRKTIQPIPHDQFEPYNHAMAKARAGKMLQRSGYTVEYEKTVPCNDLIDLTYVHPFRLDVYAELKLPFEGSFIDPDSKVIHFVDEPVVDVIAIEIGGLDTYHSKYKFAKRQERKKEMVCKQYNIPPERYFVLEKDWLFSKKYIVDDGEVFQKLKIRNGM